MTDAARRILLAILVLGVVGVIAELLLLNHIEYASQWIPLGLGTATLLFSATVAIKPTTATIRLFQLALRGYSVAGQQASRPAGQQASSTVE